ARARARRGLARPPPGGDPAHHGPVPSRGESLELGDRLQADVRARARGGRGGRAAAPAFARARLPRVPSAAHGPVGLPRGRGRERSLGPPLSARVRAERLLLDALVRVHAPLPDVARVRRPRARAVLPRSRGRGLPPAPRARAAARARGTRSGRGLPRDRAALPPRPRGGARVRRLLDGTDGGTARAEDRVRRHDGGAARGRRGRGRDLLAAGQALRAGGEPPRGRGAGARPVPVGSEPETTIAPVKKPLDDYGKKRDFERTPEPAPKRPRRKRGSEPIFVVHRHEARRLHYDLRLERAGVLLSWAVPKGFSYDPADKHLAVRTEDHPLEYEDFHGVIPKGEYGAGTMQIWDRGLVTYLNGEGGPESGEVKIVLRGRRLRGEWHLVQTKQGPNTWLIFKSRDRYAGVRRDTVLGADLSQAEEAPLPARVEPMEPGRGSAPFSDTGWLFEARFAGTRVLARKAGDEVHLVGETRLSAGIAADL